MRARGHLMLTILLYVLCAGYLSNPQEVLLSPFLAFYCLTAMVGSLFPDLDWTIAKIVPGFGHRNPLTHSFLVPILLFISIYDFKISQPVLLNFYNAFTFGTATHLFGDLIKTGNLTWINSRKYENTWYILNGIALMVLLYLTGFFKFFES